MKPSPSNQPVSRNDINYIVLQGAEHPAIKSNHGSLANLFIHEAAGSCLPCLCSHLLFLPCRSAMCTLWSTMPPKPFAPGAQHRAGCLPKMLGVPLSLGMDLSHGDAPHVVPAHGLSPTILTPTWLWGRAEMGQGAWRCPPAPCHHPSPCYHL